MNIMWPAVVMFLAISKTVHHSSPCCKGLEHYYCLPQKPENIIIDVRRPFYDLFKKPTKFNWDFELIGRQPKDNLDQLSREDFARTRGMRGFNPRDPVERVDHYTQLIPESLINTEDEITHLSSMESTNDVIGGPWNIDNNFYAKY